MKRKVVILLGVFVAFLGLLAALPEAPAMKPSRLAKHLPERLGDWQGNPREPSEAEKQKLASDTEFERMEYFDPIKLLPSIEVSIVFSGQNLSQSIHRPEVCMRAQGWAFVEERDTVLKGVLPGGADLPVRELICSRPWMKMGEDEKLEPVRLPNGEVAQIWRAFYYTFFGHEAIVAGHYERTFSDIKDRLFKGYDQRWAYATFSSFITERHTEQGISMGTWETMNDAETKGHIEEFLGRLLPLVVAEPGMGVDATLSGKEVAKE